MEWGKPHFINTMKIKDIMGYEYPDFEERAARMRVLWSKARNMYSSFFSELQGIKNEINDERIFAAWVIDELGVSVRGLAQTSNVLTETDAEIQKRELESAKEAEKDRIEAERTARRVAREAKVDATQVKKAAQRAALQLERENARAALERQVAERKKAADNARRQELREEKKERILTVPPAGLLADLLSQCAAIEATSRIELGQRYAAMKEEVDMHRAGKNADRKFWTWVGWSAAFICRPLRTIQDNIRNYEDSLLKTQELRVSQNENVVPIRKNIP